MSNLFFSGLLTGFGLGALWAIVNSRKPVTNLAILDDKGNRLVNAMVWPSHKRVELTVRDPDDHNKYLLHVVKKNDNTFIEYNGVLLKDATVDVVDTVVP